MKAMFLRVGIDSTTGGFIAPIFKDRTYKFIPIPECKKETKESKNYNLFKKYVPSDIFYFENKKEWWNLKFKEVVLHNDPDFNNMTYGDPINKGNRLSKLEKGDYLIFWQSFYPYIEEYKTNKLKDIEKIQSKYYKVMAVIGYFKLKENPVKLLDHNKKNMILKLKNNAHILTHNYDEKTMIFSGLKSESKQLKKAIPISWEYNKKTKGYIGNKYLKKFGLNDKRFQRSSDIHILENKKAEEFIKFLEEDFKINFFDKDKLMKTMGVRK